MVSRLNFSLFLPKASYLAGLSRKPQKAGDIRLYSRQHKLGTGTNFISPILRNSDCGKNEIVKNNGYPISSILWNAEIGACPHFYVPIFI